jgi:cobalt/nickel transport system permease protein
VFLLLLISIVVVAQNLIILLVAYASVLAVYCVGGLPKRKLPKWYLLPVSFVLIIAVFFIFDEPGYALIGIDFYGLSLRLTDTGLLILAKLLVKSLIMVTFSLTFVMTTKYADLAYLAKKLLPSPINSMFLLSYRFSFVVFENISTMLKAVRSRGGALVRGFLGESRLYGAVFATSLVHSIEKAQRVGKAMEARGFSGELPVYQTPRVPSSAEIFFTVLTVVLLVISYFGGIVF